MISFKLGTSLFLNKKANLLTSRNYALWTIKHGQFQNIHEFNSGQEWHVVVGVVQPDYANLAQRPESGTFMK